MISFLKHNEIDKSKWDNCIKSSLNSLIYANSFYLDKISPEWNAIILNDYEAVMPLTCRKKYFINYLYQPAFFQQGGVFSAKLITEELLIEFLNLASKHYRYIDVTLNYLNNITPISNISLVEKNNYILRLNKSSFIEVTARDGFKQALVNADKQDLAYGNSTDYNFAINMYKDLYEDRMPSVDQDDYKNFSEICHICYASNNLIIRTIHFKNKIEALVLLLKDNNRIYNLISCITEQGKKLNANYFLYYNLIKEFSNSKLILDLEGSDIPGVEFFYKRITDENQNYNSIKINKLPFGIKS